MLNSVTGTDLDLADLPLDQWLDMIANVADERGYFAPLGPSHSAIFTDDGPRLLVTFESVASIKERSADGLPVGFALTEDEGWSHLGIVAHHGGWFRDPHIWSYFDRLVDEGFLEDFDHVVFYGAGACGYAAAAYSVAAPGATVVLVSPQATLEGRRTVWDRRFPKARRLDFTTRFGYAPDMLDAAERAFVLYDPKVEEDAMHASLFARPHVQLFPLRHFGTDPELALLDMGALGDILEAAMRGGMGPRDIAGPLRWRKGNSSYLRALLSACEQRGRPLLTGLLSRYVLTERGRAPRFRRALSLAEAELEENGMRLPVQLASVVPDRA